MIRIAAAQLIHDNLVKALAKHYSSLGYIGIRTDIPGSLETPTSIFWQATPDKKYIPDITCFKKDEKNTLIIAEAETADTLNSQHIEEEWKLFAAHAKQKNGEFHVIIPESCKNAASQFATQFGIKVDHYWWLPNI